MTPAAVLSVVVRANTAQANSALTRTHGLMQGMAATGGVFSERVARGMKLITLGALGLGAASGVMAIDFEKAMRNVNSLAKLPEPQFRKLSDSVLSLAGPTAQAPEVLAKGLYDLVSSGFDANESMIILKQSAIGASAGLTTAEISTKAVAAVLNAYRRPATDAQKVTDDLFQTVNLGVLTFEDLATTIGDVLPFASTLGVNIKAVGAATSTMTRAGLSAPETMTRIKNTMVALIKPTDDLEAAYRQLGVSGGEELIRKMGGGTVGFQRSLEAIIGTTDGTKEALAKLFPNIRSLGGVLALTGGNAGRAAEDLKAFRDTSGATARVFEEQQKSAALKIQKAWAEIQESLIRLGAAFAPVIAQMVHWLAVLIGAFEALPGPVKTFIVVAGLLAYPIFKAVLMMRLMAAALGIIEIQALAAGAATEVAAGQMTLFGSAAASSRAAMIGSLGLAGGIAAVVAGGVFLAAQWEKNNDAFKKGKEASKALNESLADQVEAFHAVKDAQKRMHDSTRTVIELEEAGKRGTKQWTRAIGNQADAWLGLSRARKDLSQIEDDSKEKAGELVDKIHEIDEGLAQLRQEATSHGEDVTNFNRYNELLRERNSLIDDLRLAQINAARANKGLEILPDDFTASISAFKERFGEKLQLKIGMVASPKISTTLQLLANQMDAIGKKPKAINILLNDKLKPTEKLQAMQKILQKLTGGNWDISMDSKDLKDAADRVRNLDAHKQVLPTIAKLARSPFKLLGHTVLFEMGKINEAVKSGKNPGKQLAASYDNIVAKIRIAMDKGKIKVRDGKAAIDKILAAKSKLKFEGIDTDKFKETFRSIDQVGQKFKTSQRNVDTSMRKMNQSVSRNMSSINAMINSAVATLGAAQGGQVNISKQNANKKMQGGFAGIVPGHGSGDIMTATAHVEPGEGLFVLNRTAMGGLARLNQDVPRRAQGGMGTNAKIPSFIGGSAGLVDDYGAGELNRVAAAAREYIKKYGGGDLAHSDSLIAVGHTLQKMGYQVGEHPAFGGVHGGHSDTSYHYKGRAIDVNHDQADEMAYLDKIYKPLSRNPNKVELLWRVKDHFDHLHLAMKSGGFAPGMIKRKGNPFGSTAYGPPWGGIQGTGVTRTGIDLTGNPHKYLVAVDPGVIPLHSKLGIWPNPFGYRGEWAAEDTGGAIQGNRIDFYDWKGRGHQNAWGEKMVSVAKAADLVRQKIKTGKGKGTQKGQRDPKLGLPQDLVNEIMGWQSLSDIYADYADRANQMEGSVFGYDEGSWLLAELKSLLPLRNRLIKMLKIIQDLRAEVQKAIEIMQERIKKAKEAMRGLKKQKDKDAAQKRIDQMKDKLEKMTGRDEGLKTKYEEYLGNLDDIQGPIVANDRFKILDSLPPVGELGGRIFDVQMSLRDFGDTKAGEGTTDPNASTGLTSAQLREIGYLKTLGVIFNPSQFAGNFARGGFIPPGMWGWTGERGPEPVYGGDSGVTVFPHGSGGGQVNVDVKLEDNRTRVYVNDELVRDIVHEENDKDARRNRGTYSAGRRP